MASYLLRVFRAALVSSLGLGGGIGLLIMIIVLTNKNEPNAFHYGLMAGLTIGGIFALLLGGMGWDGVGWGGMGLARDWRSCWIACHSPPQCGDWVAMGSWSPVPRLAPSTSFSRLV